MSRLLTIAVLLTASVALAKPRIAVMPFTGPKAAKVKTQISKKLCAKYTCVSNSGLNFTADKVRAPPPAKCAP